jgi:two-component system, LytTR family, response regulator
MKYTAIIIDDEKDARDSLQTRINKYFKEFNVLACLPSAKDGITAIKELKPDLVFLDIEMPKANGFTVLDAFTNPEFEVIFITAHENYTLKAIKVDTLDYLLKPVDQEELEKAITKFKNKISRNKKEIKLFTTNKNQNHKLLIPCSYGFDFININNIIYCKADRNYTNIKLINNEEKIISKTIKEFEKQLSEHHFIRIHQSFLINFNHVSSYRKSRGGSVIMSNKDELSVSAAKKENFLNFFNKI